MGSARRTAFRVIVWGLAGLVWIPLLGSAESSSARLTFIKVFPGSQPEYTRLTVGENGAATYEGRSLEESSDPVSFQLSAKTTTRLFALAAALNYFQGTELEAGRKVANLGQKTFAYEKGERRNEVSYNFTQNATAEELQELCAGIARGRFWIQQLEFRLYFDRLGVLGAIRGLERDFNAGLLREPQQLVPVLKRIAADQRLMRLARSRAAALLRRIQTSSSRLQFEYGDEEAGWYYRLVVEDDGSATYERRRFDQPAEPQPFEIPAAAVARLFELVRQTHYLREFKSYQEPGLRLRGYRLTYEAGAEHNEIVFSAPPTAAVAEMVHVFRKALQQDHYRSRLQAAVDEQSVMLQVILQELEAAIGRDQLMQPKEFVPLLRKIVESGEQHAQTRAQAQRVLARIQGIP